MTAIPMDRRGVVLRPLALPSEHGAWSLLIEPIALGLLVAPSWNGALVAVAAAFGFLARQPLRLALQDAMRGKEYPRTRYCWILAGAYGGAAALAFTAAVGMSGLRILIPLVVVAPLALIQMLYDARNRGRQLIAEMSGAAALCGIAAVVGLAGGMEIAAAFGLAGILVARSLPAILYVRAVLRLPAGVLDGRTQSPLQLAIAAHIFAVFAMALYAAPLVVAAMVVLLVRAIYGLTHEPPRPRTVGWREVVFGVMTIGLAAA